MVDWHEDWHSSTNEHITEETVKQFAKSADLLLASTHSFLLDVASYLPSPAENEAATAVGKPNSKKAQKSKANIALHLPNAGDDKLLVTGIDYPIPADWPRPRQTTSLVYAGSLDDGNIFVIPVVFCFSAYHLCMSSGSSSGVCFS